jgi:methyltransferase-like protein 23
MLTTAVIKTFVINKTLIELFVPADPYQASTIKSPYWAKVWPAAIGLCHFLHDNKQHIKNKKVLELAAGLGLPSIFSANYANHISSSDIEPAAVRFLQESFRYHQLDHTNCQVLDWSNAKTMDIPDTLLLSDINYEPDQFDELFSIIQHFLYHNTTIVLSTPQRLMAKDFISQLLPWCRQQVEVMVTQDNIKSAISILVLKR